MCVCMFLFVLHVDYVDLVLCRVDVLCSVSCVLIHVFLVVRLIVPTLLLVFVVHLCCSLFYEFDCLSFSFESCFAFVFLARVIMLSFFLVMNCTWKVNIGCVCV